VYTVYTLLALRARGGGVGLEFFVSKVSKVSKIRYRSYRVRSVGVCVWSVWSVWCRVGNGSR